MVTLRPLRIGVIASFRGVAAALLVLVTASGPTGCGRKQITPFVVEDSGVGPNPNPPDAEPPPPAPRLIDLVVNVEHLPFPTGTPVAVELEGTPFALRSSARIDDERARVVFEAALPPEFEGPVEVLVFVDFDQDGACTPGTDAVFFAKRTIVRGASEAVLTFSVRDPGIEPVECDEMPIHPLPPPIDILVEGEGFGTFEGRSVVLSVFGEQRRTPVIDGAFREVFPEALIPPADSIVEVPVLAFIDVDDDGTCREGQDVALEHSEIVPAPMGVLFVRLTPENIVSAASVCPFLGSEPPTLRVDITVDGGPEGVIAHAFLDSSPFGAWQTAEVLESIAVFEFPLSPDPPPYLLVGFIDFDADFDCIDGIDLPFSKTLESHEEPVFSVRELDPSTCERIAALGFP